MNALFDRRCKVTIAKPVKGSFAKMEPNAIEITDLRIAFSIEKKLQKSPNTAEIVIYNLSEATRALVQKKPLHIRLEAGYLNDVRLMWMGDMTFSHSKKEGTEWVTTIEVANGMRAFNYARVSRTFSPAKGGANTTAYDVLNEVSQAMGMKLSCPPAVKEQLVATELKQGLTVHGPARKALERCLPRGVEWSFQDNQIQVLQKGGLRADQAWVISEDTGLIGSPEFNPPTKPGEKAVLKFKTLMHADLVPGQKIEVQADAIKGVFRMEAVRHRGDNFTADFVSEVEAKPV